MCFKRLEVRAQLERPAQAGPHQHTEATCTLRLYTRIQRDRSEVATRV